MAAWSDYAQTQRSHPPARRRFEVAVPVGRDPITKRYRYLYEQAATLEEAEEARGWLLDELAAGRRPKDRKTTFGDLLDDMLETADLEFAPGSAARAGPNTT
jgi:hypothetical protein